MRIIGGIHKGKKLFFIKEKDVRPTKNVVREAIFDTLRGWIVNKKVIELFAGTGAIGIEAISEGAEKVIFVENRKKAINILRKNISHIGIENKTVILKGEVEDKIIEMKNFKYDLLIADPPYEIPEEKMEKIIEKVIDLNLINEEGIIVVEHKSKYSIPESEKFEVFKKRKYGKTALSYLKRKKDEK